MTAQLPEDEFDVLERRLTLDISRLTPGTFRSTAEIVEEPDEVEVPRREQLREAAEDLLAHARHGISIAAQVESRSLVALFEAADEKLPPTVVADQALGYEYYVVEVTTTTLLPEDQRPLSAKLAIRLGDDVAEEARRLRPYRLFPAREDVELFSVNLEGAVGLNANLDVSVPGAVSGILPFSSVGAEAKVNAGIVVGPYRFPFRKAKIEVIGEADQNIVWFYNMQSALWGTNIFKSILVLKIAREATTAEMGIALSLVPYKRFWLIFKDRLPELRASAGKPIELLPDREGL